MKILVTGGAGFIGPHVKQQKNKGFICVLQRNHSMMITVWFTNFVYKIARFFFEGLQEGTNRYGKESYTDAINSL